jgi:DNA-binding transcriptional LysR family regulator
MATLKQLAHARALARHGNFHRAAKSQNISQPALSRSIRTLEEQLGVPLFDRQGATVNPTLYGTALLQRAENIFGETAELTREIQLLKGLDAGSLHIAMGVYAGEISASRAAGELIERHPEIQCRLRLTDWTQVADLVASRAVDLGIAEISTLEGRDELEIEPVGRHRLILFCRSGHPLGTAASVAKADLDDYPTVAVRLPPRVAGVFPGRTSLDRQTGELLPSVEVDDLASARTVIANSDAFGVAAPLQIEPWLRSGDFVALPFDARWLQLDYGFIYLRNRMLSPATILFMQTVRRIEEALHRHNEALVAELAPKAPRGCV